MSGNSRRLDALIAREYMAGGEQRTAWTKVGSAFVNQNGSISIVLDAIPVDWSTSKLVLMEPKEWGDRPRGGGGGYQQRNGGGGGFRGRQRGRSQPQRGGFQQSLPPFPEDQGGGGDDGEWGVDGGFPDDPDEGLPR